MSLLRRKRTFPNRSCQFRCKSRDLGYVVILNSSLGFSLFGRSGPDGSTPNRSGNDYDCESRGVHRYG